MASSIELVGFILDASKSMFNVIDAPISLEGTSIVAPTRFYLAVYTIASLINRLKNSSLSSSYYVSLVLFSDKAEDLMSKIVNTPFIHAEDDNAVATVYEKLTKEIAGYTFDDIEKNFGMNGETNYGAAFEKALEISKEFATVAEQESDCAMVSRFFLTDGCHTAAFDIEPDEIIRLADDLNNLDSVVAGIVDPGFEIYSKLAMTLIGRRRDFLGCADFVCELAPVLEDSVRERLEKIGYGPSSPTPLLFDKCMNKMIFHIQKRDKSLIEALRQIIRVVTGTLKLS